MKAAEISKYVIAKFDFYGDLLTNKKLQKLLYYIEAWSLVYINSIIDEDFEAWVHGPVIPDIYHKYKEFGYSPIKLDYNALKAEEYISKLTKENNIRKNQIKLIDSVLKTYGVLSSYELEMLSHSEEPWIKARKNYAPIDNCTEIIDKEAIKTYYKSLLK